MVFSYLRCSCCRWDACDFTGFATTLERLLFSSIDVFVEVSELRDTAMRVCIISRDSPLLVVPLVLSTWRLYSCIQSRLTMVYRW